MNLIIDIGNTFAKTAVMERSEILHKTVARELSCTALEEVLHTHPAIDRAILSTTRNPDPAIEAYLQEHVPCFVRFTPATPVPLVNRYATPETLGADRLAAAVGAWDIAPERELLIVDLGSAITLDRVSAAGEYLGGNISPGMAMRFEALHRLTDRLPLCTTPQHVDLTGTSTRNAIESGVVLGILHEIEGYIDRLGEKNETLTVFFAGRDANFFAEKVKKPIFVAYDLVIKGLNRILEYNAQP
ncbi:MAG TPA: type III pantothenate kinase [Candidatus Rikenella faecigallinarum]|uniref:Type III pantothenate kinase n=1 Tax=Candidatus Rikenella faecigallinarum TaxID=2838745 RepID=A0A9D1TXP9_9BACT|nr:type III pantothenate kinase [Candidatus Rikenella faecigallinarum]